MAHTREEEALRLAGPLRGRQTQTQHRFDLAEFLADTRQRTVELPQDPQDEAVNHQGAEDRDERAKTSPGGLLMGV